jgi:hypothetical protein
MEVAGGIVPIFIADQLKRALLAWEIKQDPKGTRLKYAKKMQQVHGREFSAEEIDAHLKKQTEFKEPAGLRKRAPSKKSPMTEARKIEYQKRWNARYQRICAERMEGATQEEKDFKEFHRKMIRVCRDFFAKHGRKLTEKEKNVYKTTGKLPSH